jgi:PKD repeat protein
MTSTNQAPNADFTYAGQGFAVYFTDASSDPENDVLACYWEFGDGITSTLQNPDHLYSAYGSYTVNLTVSDGEFSDTTSKIVVTAPTNRAPNADFSYVIEGFVVHFTDASSDPDGDMVTYYWEFGDGTSSGLKNPDHTYSDHGSYTVNLTVDDGELSDMVSKTVTISEPVTGHMVINEVESNPPGTDAGYEWVELYNPTGAAVDVSGWKLQTTAGAIETYIIPNGIVIPAGVFVVITFPSQFLDNEQESVVLFDQSNTEIDRTPVLSDTDNDARTWQRIPNGVDTDIASDWQFLIGTKGWPNS